MTPNFRGALDEKDHAELTAHAEFRATAKKFVELAARLKYTYGFSWLGRPFIQFPQDMVAMQEIVWAVKPDLIVETGVAHGGGLVFYASLLQLIGGNGKVVGVDVEVRPHNRKAIEEHPLSKRIELVIGSSVAPEVIAKVKALAKNAKKVLVVLDSLHTHAHVLDELKLYAPLVKAGSYLVVFDTLVEEMPADMYPNRPWGPGDNPKTAVDEFLKTNKRFEVDTEIESKLFLTVAPGGYLKCTRDA